MITNFFTYIYFFFQNRKILFFSFIFLIFGLSIYFASNLSIEEDISKIIPKDERIEKFNFVFKYSKFIDKMVVNISLSDKSKKAEPEKLFSFADALTEDIKKELYPNYIKKITYKISNEFIYKIHDFLYNNIPLFLEKSDYKKMDKMLQQRELRSRLESSYKILISPAGIVLKKFILKDPIGITTLALNKLNDLKIDKNYEIVENRIMANNKKNLLIFLEPALPQYETSKNAFMIEKLDEIINRNNTKNKNEINAEYFGSTAIAVSNAYRMKKDIITTVIIALFFVFCVISFFFKRFFIIFFLFIPVLLGGLTALSVFYLTQSKISAISLGIGCVLLGITIDYSLHIFTHFKSKGSIHNIFKDIPFPILMSSTTTVSAFICLLFVKSEILSNLGILAAISVLVAAFSSIIILPHFLKKRKDTDFKKEKGNPIYSYLTRFTSYNFHRNKYFIACIVIMSVVFIFTFRWVEFEKNIEKLNYLPRNLERAQENLNSISSIARKSVFLISHGDSFENAIKNSEKNISTLKRLKKEGTIENFTSINSLIMSKERQGKLLENWKRFWTLEKKKKLKNLLLQEGKKLKFKEKFFYPFFEFLDRDFNILERDGFSVLSDLFTKDFIIEKKGTTAIITLIKVKEKEKKKLHSTFLNKTNNVILDKKYFLSKLISIVRSEYKKLVRYSLIVVFLILLICFGRIELAIITFIPMFLSWVWTLGIMGLLGIKFNIFNIIISTFIFGLGIDYSIFIMHGLLQEYKHGEKNLDSYKTSILLSAFTTISGMGALIFAKHPILNSIAGLSIVGIISVLFIAFTVQPIFFKWLTYSNNNKRKVPVTISSLFFTMFSYGAFITGAFLIIFIEITFLKILPINKKRKKYLIHYIIRAFAKGLIYMTFVFKKEIINPLNENFSKPSVIIANHSSFLDILILLMMHPKLIMFTNEWAYNSPIFGRILRKSNFYAVSSGFEEIISDLEERIKEGYSIIVFPEGTRSVNGKIGRFHKGAFYLAEHFKLDILPIVLHGPWNIIPKKEFFINKGKITMKFLPRIPYNDERFGGTYSQRTKNISKHFKKEFHELKEFLETPKYFKEYLLKNYIFKGPLLEMLIKSKLNMEKYYQELNKLVPKEASILEIGCGFGFLSYLLHLTGENRKIKAIDNEKDKIDVANSCVLKNESIQFSCQDILNYPIDKEDTFIINGNFLSFNKMEDLISKIANNLKNDGIIIIYDEIKEFKTKSIFSNLWKNFIFRMMKMNSTDKTLISLKESEINQISKKFNMKMESINSVLNHSIYVLAPLEREQKEGLI